MIRVSLLLTLVTVTVFGQPTAGSKWIPLRAGFRTVITTTMDRGTSTRELQEILVRDAAGNELRSRAIVAAGMPGPAVDGEFLDGKTVYHELNYARRRATLRFRDGAPRSHFDPNTHYDLGSGTILGHVCRGSALFDHDQPEKKIGEMWVYVPYDLVVRVEFAPTDLPSRMLSEPVDIETRGPWRVRSSYPRGFHSRDRTRATARLCALSGNPIARHAAAPGPNGFSVNADARCRVYFMLGFR